jgi:hypothetical protein
MGMYNDEMKERQSSMLVFRKLSEKLYGLVSTHMRVLIVLACMPNTGIPRGVSTDGMLLRRVLKPESLQIWRGLAHPDVTPPRFLGVAGRKVNFGGGARFARFFVEK